MPQTTKKIKSETHVITSPDGEKIQITAGRKLQQIRTFMRDPEITDAQFRVLSCLVDRLNDGTKDQESRWGSAYPQYETLANDVAKDIRSTKRIIKELETGQRETRTGGVTKLVQCKEILSVERSEGKPGRGDVNQYRLKEWGAFAVKDKGDVTCQEGCGDPSERVRSPVKKGAVTTPDSTHLLPSASTSSNSENASGVDPAVSEDRRKEATNDNEESGNDSRSTSWPDYAFDRFWKRYPNRVGEKTARSEFERVASSGKVTWEEFRIGVNFYIENKPEDREWLSPVTLIRDERWKDRPAKSPAPAKRYEKPRMAI